MQEWLLPQPAVSAAVLVLLRARAQWLHPGHSSPAPALCASFWSHLQNCQKENTVTRDWQVGKSQAIPLKSNPQSSVAGGEEPAGLSWDPAARPVLLSPILFLEFPLLSVCGRCLVARGAQGILRMQWGGLGSLSVVGPPPRDKQETWDDSIKTANSVHRNESTLPVPQPFRGHQACFYLLKWSSHL